MQFWPINCKTQIMITSIIAVGCCIKKVIDGISSPVTTAIVKTKKKANKLAAVNKWLAVGLKVTFEYAWESLKKASATIDTKISR